MCLIVFAYKSHPRFNLILAANRDEQFDRPTREAQFWDGNPTVLAGKDLSAGGTWMGINKRGQFAALTNYRDPSISKRNPPSRGLIVRDYLMGEGDSAPFLKELNEKSDQYMGFNILVGSSDELFHYSNQEKKINIVEPGVHGLSNHLLDTPWPKVQRSKAALQTLLEEKELTVEALFEILLDEQPAPDEELPDTGIPHELEKRVSPIFLKTDGYGTRSSTVLLIDKKGNVTFEERRYKARKTVVKETNRFEFEVEG
jgi:uncharacterized protein with NRDE domain